jgi:hypothetical protein
MHQSLTRFHLISVIREFELNESLDTKKLADFGKACNFDSENRGAVADWMLRGHDHSFNLLLIPADVILLVIAMFLIVEIFQLIRKNKALK